MSSLQADLFGFVGAVPKERRRRAPREPWRPNIAIVRDDEGAPAAMHFGAPAKPERPSIADRWEAFKRANPHVLPEMLRLARARVAGGATRIGTKALWEELRESLKVAKLGDYKLNNDFTSRAADDLVALDPSLDGVIERRKRRAK